MSLWGFDGEDNSLAWSSLSQFDDGVWNDFGEAYGDHVVPNPGSPQNSWLANGDRRKRMHREPSLSASTIKEASATSTVVADTASELSSDIQNRSKEVLEEGTPSQPASLSECRWAGLESVDAELTAESEPFSSGHPPASRGTDETGDEVGEDHQSTSTMKEESQLYTCKEDASMASDPFSISEIGSRNGGLEIFGSENVVTKGDALLELGWENISNLDDMDKLFRNNDTSFEPVLASGTEGLDWPSASSPTVDALDSGMQFEKPSPLSESTAAKAEVDELEDKTELVFDDCLPGLAMDTLDDVVADNGSPRSLRISVGEPGQQDSLPCEDGVESKEAKASCEIVLSKERPTERTGISKASVPEAEKLSPAQAYRARRHAANRKRSEDRFKRTTAYRKLSPGPPYNIHLTDGRQLQTLPLRIPGQPGQPPLLRPATTFPPQYFPQAATPGLIGPHQQQKSQGVPYIQVAYPVHHVPAITSGASIPMTHMQHPQSIFVDISQTVPQGQRPPIVTSQANPTSWPFDASNRPPTSSLDMTPQEKMEKLRWRQQMQARMAVEQQQQQLLAPQNRDRSDPMYQKQQLAVCQDQPRRPPKSTYDQAVNPLLDPLEADERVLVKDGIVPSVIDKGEVDCLEGSVLCQLKSTVSTLDIGTRVCIRDALYRLARSAMKRRAAGSDILNGSQGSEHDSDANAVESSTASGPPSSGHSKATSMSVVETQTNPIDRSIAKLLFSPPQPTMFGRPYAFT